jgi:integrase
VSKGNIYQQKDSAYWWVTYYVNGKRHRESSHSTKKADALLEQRQCEIHQGRPVGPEVTKTTFMDLMQMVRDDYAANRRKMRLSGYIGHLTAMFGHDYAVQITTDRITKYTAQRLARGAAPASINRELATLRRGFNLASRAERVAKVPHFAMLEEDNARKGFFEREQLEAVLRHLPEHYHAAVRTAYITGWRLHSEIFTRRMMHLDLVNGWLRADPGETKNKAGRMFPLTEELRTILEAQVKSVREYEKEHGVIVPWLFHRDGQHVTGFRKAWKTACRLAGVPGAIPHDFRRTAVQPRTGGCAAQFSDENGWT